MSIEERLRDAFAQRAEGVEVSPGALFEIQRRAGHRRRMPEVRLRPALVLAAAACAAIAVAISVSVTRPSTDPPIATQTPPVAGTADTAAVTPTTAEPPPTPEPPTPAPPAVAPVDPQPSGSGQITTAPATTPPTPPAPVTTAPPSDAAPATDVAPDSDDTATTETPACPEEPESDGDDSASGWVTVYFACGESDAAPRQRAAAANNLPTALGILLGGPSEADSTAGFRGLSGNTATTVTTMTSNRWVTIDLPAGLAEAFPGGDGDITAQQFLAQLDATVFQFTGFDIAEYRLDGDCAAFGALIESSCHIRTRDSDGYTGHTSDLTAHTIGNVDSVIRAEPDDAAAELDLLRDGTRLTDRRAGSGGDAWAEVVTVAGDRGWVSTQTIVAQPLVIDSTTGATMADLARRLTTGPGLESSAFMPAGLVLRWGADTGDLTVVSTADAGTGAVWWHASIETTSPRDGSPESSLSDLLWIDGSSDDAVVTINTPGPLGEPHSDFASLAYVSVYQAAVDVSNLPDPLEPRPAITLPTSDSEESDLPPPLPEPGAGTDGADDTEEQPDPPRAQISVIFDFLSPDGPRVAAVEAIWIQP